MAGMPAPAIARGGTAPPVDIIRWCLCVRRRPRRHHARHAASCRAFSSIERRRAGVPRSSRQQRSEGDVRPVHTALNGKPTLDNQQSRTRWACGGCTSTVAARSDQHAAFMRALLAAAFVPARGGWAFPAHRRAFWSGASFTMSLLLIFYLNFKLARRDLGRPIRTRCATATTSSSELRRGGGRARTRAWETPAMIGTRTAREDDDVEPPRAGEAGVARRYARRGPALYELTSNRAHHRRRATSPRIANSVSRTACWSQSAI